MLKIEMGIGWKRDPENPKGLVSADIIDYVAEIVRLRTALQKIASDAKNCAAYCRRQAQRAVD